MAIKSVANENAACIKTKERNEITTHAVNFNAHTHSHLYKNTRTLLAPRAYTQYRRFWIQMFPTPPPCVGLLWFFFINLYHTFAELSHCLNVRLRGDLAASIICNWNMALCLLYAQPLSAIKYATLFDLSCAFVRSAMHSHTHTHTCINWNEVPATFVHISEILIFIYRPCGCDIRRDQRQLLCVCVCVCAC